MKTKILNLILVLYALLFLSAAFPAHAQEVKSFTLKEAMDYAVANSYKTKMANLDFKSSVAKRKGYVAIGLPQVNASASYQKYISLPTQLIPNFFIPGGPDLELTFGKTDNMTVSGSASQLLFDGSFLVGLKAAALYVDMNKITVDKSVNETRAMIAQAYMLVLVAQENLRILDSTFINMNEILKQNTVIQANGFMDETDIEQLTLNVSNLKSKLDNTRQNISLITDMLKFQMGIDIDEQIILKDNLKLLIDLAIASALADKQFDVNTHFDYQLIKSTERLLHQALKVDQSKYYPTLSMYFNAQSNAQRDRFDFFKSGGKWFNTSLVGFNLSIPIWSSGIRHYQIQQDKNNYLKQQILVKQTEEGLKMDVQSSKSNLKMFTDQFYIDKKNLELSGKIYRKTNMKFKEGLASSMDLNQAYLQLLTQEGNYINTIMQLLTTYTNLSKALNTL
jgi:outer membrane protein